MSNISKAFINGKAFIPFITCGDPDIDTTKKIIIKAVEAGADLIELGVPFSDPTAEGDVIRKANERALSAGITTDKIFEMVAQLRPVIKKPLVIMTYANVIYSYRTSLNKDMEVSGSKAFAKMCAQVGIDGIILPDVPFEEKEEFDSVFAKYDIDFISLIAPTSKERIKMIAKEAKGFIYVVSSLGVTGVRSNITTDIPAMVELVRDVTDLPCAVGFGISNPEQAKEMAKVSDGAIVGSAIMKIIEEHKNNAPDRVYEYIKEMSVAVHSL